MIGVVPARGLAFIRRIVTAETYANSPIVLTNKSRDAVANCQFTIVAVGNYEYCDDDECPRRHSKRVRHATRRGEPVTVREHPHQLKVTDWVLVKNKSWNATPDPNVYLVKQSDILGKFEEG
jgi:hypothetical protein